MKNSIPWLMAILGLGFASWAVCTEGGAVSWGMGCAPTWLGGEGWTYGQQNISSATAP